METSGRQFIGPAAHTVLGNASRQISWRDEDRNGHDFFTFPWLMLSSRSRRRWMSIFSSPSSDEPRATCTDARLHQVPTSCRRALLRHIETPRWPCPHYPTGRSPRWCRSCWNMLLYAAFCVAAYPVSQFSSFHRITSWPDWSSCFPWRIPATCTQ